MGRLAEGVLGGLVLASLAGCGPPPPGDTPPEVDAYAAVDGIATAWPVRLAEPGAQAALAAQSSGWVSLLRDRQYERATAELGAVGGLPAARAHADQAALYREAALVCAHAYVVTYGENAQDTDPAGVSHLLAVSYALLGELDAARVASDRVPAGDVTAAWHAPWRAWLRSADPTWPPDLASLPLVLPDVAIGTSPAVPSPSYALADAGGSTFDVGDPAALVALSLWHEAAARQAVGGDLVALAAVDTYLAPHRFPVEPDVVGVDLPFELLVGSDFLVPSDGAFIADLHSADGAAATAAWADRSVLAALALASHADGATGAFSGEIAGERAGHLADQLRSTALVASGGNDDRVHRAFARTAHAGALRLLAPVPEIEGAPDGVEGGKLRLLAADLGDVEPGAAAPEGLLALAAWQASHGYTLRGADIVHAQARRYPSLAVARYALDVLGVRVSRQREGPPPAQ